MSYWISDGVSQNGPYPPEELPQRGLTGDSLVWREGMADWKRAAEVPELAALLSDEQAANPQAPAPDPAPQPVMAPQAVVATPADPSRQSPQTPIAYHSPFQQAAGYGYAAPQPQGMAIASLVLGIVSLMLLGAYCVGVVPAILAVIFGHISLGRNRAGLESGQGMAMAGLICGYISLGLAVVGLLIVGVVIIAAAAA
jgi:hypothetical protein